MLFKKKTMAAMLGVFVALGLLACSDNSEVAAVGTGTTTTTTGETVLPTLSLALTDSSAQAITTISNGSAATATVTVTDAAGAALVNAVVIFTVDTAGVAVLTPSSGTALTNASGVATVSLAPASLAASGAATLTATTQVGTVAVSESIGFAVGAASVTISTPTFGVGMADLSAYGTTSVSVSISSAGVLVTTPQNVSFTSVCTASGKAVLTAEVATVGGVATASYLDNGCAGNDTVTASVSGITTASGTLNVIAPNSGSIQFDSVAPASGLINPRGIGGQESALVTFKVVDTSGNPIGGKNVTFSLNTSVGGITITPTSATSDPLTGNVVVSVQAGTISTPVRVSASTVEGLITLTSQSNSLVISTGIPDQRNFSLSATELNIEGFNVDGITTTLTARMADHFNNPALDGTAIFFTTEGGSIEASCFTLDGACSVALTSQQIKPANGRVTVLAYAIGEEGFTDNVVNNGLADGLPEMLDINNNSTDMPEAFLDINENGIFDSNEVFTDFNGDGVYNPADGLYNGVLCDPSAIGTATACNAQKSIHVRGSIPIIFSGSFATITLSSIALPQCTAGGGGGVGAAASFNVRVLDQNRNAMPVGTTIKFSTTNGEILSPTDFIVGSTTGCNTGGACPASAANPGFGNYPVTMKGDAAFAAATGLCTNASASGILTVVVTTPRSNITTSLATVTD
jgi:hypothetical protein